MHRLCRGESYPQVGGKSYAQVGGWESYPQVMQGYARAKVIHRLCGCDQVSGWESYAGAGERAGAGQAGYAGQVRPGATR